MILVPLMLMLSTLFKLVIVLSPLMIRVSVPAPPSTVSLVPASGVAADRSIVSSPAPALIVSGSLVLSVYWWKIIAFRFKIIKNIFWR